MVTVENQSRNSHSIWQNLSTHFVEANGNSHRATIYPSGFIALDIMEEDELYSSLSRALEVK